VVRSCFGGPREEFVFSGSEDAQVYIWHRHYGSLLQVLAGHTAAVNSVCWSSARGEGGPWLISTADDHTLRVWSAGSEASSMEAGDAPAASEQEDGDSASEASPGPTPEEEPPLAVAADTAPPQRQGAPDDDGSHRGGDAEESGADH